MAETFGGWVKIDKMLMEDPIAMEEAVKEAKQELAVQAGMALKDWMLENDAFMWKGGGDFEGLTIGWKQTLGGIPTADAAPVVHGRWIGKPLHCSVCGTAAPIRKERSFKQKHEGKQGHHVIWRDAKYCPNCGAKMNLEVQS